MSYYYIPVLFAYYLRHTKGFFLQTQPMVPMQLFYCSLPITYC